MNKKERDIIFLLAQKLTGAHPEGTFRHGIFITNVESRMRATKIDDVSEYLKFASSNSEEHLHLISALSIHTTSWFRENPHYVILQKIILKFLGSVRPYRVWSSACSTGEEVYSLALLFEEFRDFHANFDYSILGTDIDPISLETAKRAVYDKKHLSGPIEFYKKHVLLGSGPTDGFFTFTKSLRERCQFKSHDVREHHKEAGLYDLIVCRNVLIYFPTVEVEKIVQNLVSHLRVGGHLILGHSEMIAYQKFGLQLSGHAVYEKTETVVSEGRVTPKVKSSTTLKKTPKDFNPELILIGASTGGPQALNHVLESVRQNCPPIVIVQHISSGFAHGFAESLSETSGLTLGLPRDKTVLKPNHIYVAENECHLAVERSDQGLVLRQFRKPPLNGHRPSVDFLFSSAADIATNTIAILLSGMGHDGARGMELLHGLGAYTLAQDESDCVVYGMPKEAIDIKAVDFIGSGRQIREKLIDLIGCRAT
jgi:chemotaxis protein methyltransferase CheR